MHKQIILHTYIYPLIIIERAIRDYSNVAPIQIVHKNEKRVVCEIECEQSEFKLIKNEFCNYLIGLINQRGKV